MTALHQFKEDLIEIRVQILVAWWLFLLVQIFNKNFDLILITFLIVGLAFTCVFLIPYIILQKTLLQPNFVEKHGSQKVQSSEVVLLLLMITTIVVTIIATYSSSDRVLAIGMLLFLGMIGILIVFIDTKFPKLTTSINFLLIYSLGMLFINLTFFALVTSKFSYIV